MQLDLDWTDPEVSGNWLEACVWEACAAGLWWGSRGPATAGKRLARRAALILVPFGVSDLVESQTGAWWTPWWLLVWKALGVLGLLACGLALLRLRWRALVTPEGLDQEPGVQRGDHHGDRVGGGL